MTEQQPKALQLADRLRNEYCDGMAFDAAKELRRLHALNQELLEAAKLCRPHMYDHASNTQDCAFEKLCVVIAKAEGEIK